jgi:hypothetical protein
MNQTTAYLQSESHLSADHHHDSYGKKPGNDTVKRTTTPRPPLVFYLPIQPTYYVWQKPAHFYSTF